VKNEVNMSGLESKWYEVCDKVKEPGARMEHPLEGRECNARSDGWAPICLAPSNRVHKRHKFCNDEVWVLYSFDGFT
jgi:hypothetical protein